MPARRAVPLTQSRVSVPREAGTGVGTSAGCPRGPPRPGPCQAAALRAGSASRGPRSPSAARRRVGAGAGFSDFQPRRGPLRHVPPHPAGPRPGSHSLAAPAARARARPPPPRSPAPGRRARAPPPGDPPRRLRCRRGRAPPAGPAAADSALSSGPRLEGMTLGCQGPQRLGNGRHEPLGVKRGLEGPQGERL